MKLVIHPEFIHLQKDIEKILTNFDVQGNLLVKGSRNTIKTYDVNSQLLNVKSFKKPNALNSIVYKFLRDSKAERSYKYALKLLKSGIGTPQPIAFSETSTALCLGKSFYVCEHIVTEFTYRDLVENPSLQDHEAMLRAFTVFCVKLHDAGIEFKDHSPGNTLIKVNEDRSFSFYLVDLNRMTFHDSMSFEERMYNLRRLTPKKEMVAIMASEYAKHFKQKSEQEIFDLLWKLTSEFQMKFHRKQSMKKKIKFWRC